MLLWKAVFETDTVRVAYPEMKDSGNIDIVSGVCVCRGAGCINYEYNLDVNIPAEAGTGLLVHTKH